MSPLVAGTDAAKSWHDARSRACRLGLQSTMRAAALLPATPIAGTSRVR